MINMNPADPFNPNLSVEQKKEIVSKCKANPVFFLTFLEDQLSPYQIRYIKDLFDRIDMLRDDISEKVEMEFDSPAQMADSLPEEELLALKTQVEIKNRSGLWYISGQLPGGDIAPSGTVRYPHRYHLHSIEDGTMYPYTCDRNDFKNILLTP